MNLKNILSVTLASLALSAAASAATYMDVDNIPNANLSAGESISGTFKFTEADVGQNTFNANGYGLLDDKTYTSVFGFNPATETVISATLAFFFTDTGNQKDPDNVETGSILVSGINFADIGNFSQKLLISGGVGQIVINEINATGEIAYIITATSGSFKFDGAVGQITTEEKDVPEGGSAFALLGLGLVSAETLRRRVLKSRM